MKQGKPSTTQIHRDVAAMDSSGSSGSQKRKAAARRGMEKGWPMAWSHSKSRELCCLAAEMMTAGYTFWNTTENTLIIFTMSNNKCFKAQICLTWLKKSHIRQLKSHALAIQWYNLHVSVHQSKINVTWHIPVIPMWIISPRLSSSTKVSLRPACLKKTRNK